MPLVKIRDALVDKCTQALFIYRHYCTTQAAAGQLILPEALKILPVYVLGLLKSAAFRPQPSTQTSPEAVSPDERAAAVIGLGSMSAAVTVSFSYPRMYSLGDMPEPAGVALAKNDQVVTQDIFRHIAQIQEPTALPPSEPLSSERLGDDLVLLVDTGSRLVVWIGDKVTPELIQEVFVVPAGATQSLLLRGEVAPQLTPDLSQRAQRIVAVVQRLLQLRPGICQVRVVVRGDPNGGEARTFLPLLVEDKGGSGGYSYVEFLRHVHRQIMNKKASESAAKDLNTWEMLSQGY
eukprot:Plantae.Rhodophyta-Rhodochaete_pulchella.ctg9890.p1 GENE.Plantae.Rhodophyta-Rhodochaete_pulchella.ctg9890~~Plantae.Rhodophyta-Rhodochaete_pulchella.ctg9890.p1  ORF type:complete len:306 (-),score=31.98 Plantae.Rhodophyta-Rhodochaete_pulchella.ctg9890:570-1445(-)